MRLVLSLFFCLALPALAGARTLTVGVYDNEPLAFQARGGDVQGFMPELLRHVAAREGWTIEWTPCAWSACLTRLDNGTIDLLAAIAYSETRAKRFRFNEENVINNWGVVYTPTGSEVESILDLAGRRVATLKGDIHEKAFAEILRRFDIPATLIPVSEYDEIFRRLATRKVDAGLVNRLYAMRAATGYAVHKTAIIFNPIEVRFASPRHAPPDALRAIDDELRRLKADQTSLYYTALERWFGAVSPGRGIPSWIWTAGAVVAGAALLLLAASVLLRRQVRLRTAELAHANAKLTAEVRDRTLAQEELAIARDYLQAIYEASPDMVFLHDGESGRLLDVNDNVLRAYAISRQEMLEAPPERVMGAGYTPDEARARVRRAASGEDLDFEWMARRAGGEEFPVEVRLRRMDRPASGESTGTYVVAVVRDLTDQKQAEREKDSLQRQLVHAQKMESVGRLAGGVAHDFNNLLSSIIGYSELALSRTSTDDTRFGYLQTINDAGEKAARLTRQLLAFSRKQFLEMTTFHLADLVRDMLKIIERTLGEDVRLQADFADGLPPVHADRAQLEQVLLNLVVNARDAMPQGGSLFLNTRAAPGPDASNPMVELSVRDTGIGIDPSIQEEIFEPFFTTKGLEQGTGLGLATSYGIVSQHGGTLVVESRPGQGTTFQIRLPAVTGTPAVVESPPAVAPPRGHGTVFVVDDVAEIRALVSDILTPLGYQVESAASPAEARTTLAGREPSGIDLLLTDVIMPDMNGLEFARAVRLEQPALPVVFMTGYADSRISVDELRDVGAAVLRKPITPRELAETVAHVLEQARS